MPGHVRCRLIDDPWQSIETTDPIWTPIGAAHVRDSGDSMQLGRLLSPVQLLAKLFYNRGLSLLSEQQYEQALAATELSWQLDPQHDAAGENVATVINNWALVLCAEGQFSHSLQLLSSRPKTSACATGTTWPSRESRCPWLPARSPPS